MHLPRRLLACLLLGAVAWPMLICVVKGVGLLLGAMGDAAGAAVLDRIVLAGAILWIVNLLALLLAQSAQSLLSERNEEEP